MQNNEVFRSLRYLLNINEKKMSEIFKLANCEVSLASIESYLKKEEDPDYKECEGKILNAFLDGIIIFKRGKNEAKPLPPLESKMSNNLVLKRLRVAFELRDEDILAILQKAGFSVSKTELSALFRKVGHEKYRECGDQFLRNFLKGLSTK